MATRTLDSFFGVKRKADAEPEIREKVRQKVDENKENIGPGTPRKRDAWQQGWERTFPWLEKIEKDGQVRALCSWCRLSNRTNSMATAGSPNLQVSTFSRHESTKEHLFAVQAQKAKDKRVTVQHIADTIADRDVENDTCKDAQINTVYYLAKYGQPLSQYINLVTLQTKNKCPDFQDKSKIYTSEESKMEMLDSVNDTIEETISRNIHSSDYLGLVIDESTDITIHKKLNVYVKCLSVDGNEPITHFLDCVNVPDGKAETIELEIKKLMKNKDIRIEKVTSLASDGASVMTGRLNGVGARLRKDVPHMIQVHCVAHKLALAAGQACKDITLFNEYQLTLKNIYRYFNNSAVRYNELRALQDFLQADEDMRHVTLKEPASFRWLSLEGAVKAISDVYPALYMELEHDAAKGVPEAKGYFNKIKNVHFVLTTAFLRDVLGVVNKLSQTFQRDELDISTVNIMVSSTIEKIESFKSNNGKELLKVYDGINNSMFREVKLCDKEQARIQFQNAANNYLDELVKNLHSRFEKESMKTLQDLNTVLNPTLVPKNTEINNYGCDELENLRDHYGGENGIVDSERIIDDFFQFKVVLKSLSNMTLRQSCVELVKKYSDMFPDFVTLAKLLLVTPLTSVACERGFSTHNKIKTKSRNRLKHSTVTKLMRIMEEGPELKEFDPKPVVRKFVEKRKRKK